MGDVGTPFSALAGSVISHPLRSCDDLENGRSVGFLDHPQPPITWMGVEKPSLCLQPSPDDGGGDRKDAGQLGEWHEPLDREGRAERTSHRGASSDGEKCDSIYEHSR